MNDPPEQPGVVVFPRTATGAAVAFAASLSVQLNWSMTWLLAAEGRAGEARRARSLSMDVNPEALTTEFHASLLAIAASAFAVEAAQKQVLGDMVTPATTPPKVIKFDGGERPRNTGDFLGQYLEERGVIGSELKLELGHLFKLRNDSVHPFAEVETPVPHPSRGSVSPEVATYNADVADESVLLAREVVKAIVDLDAAGEP